MKIKKILNNNAVITFNEIGQEIIVMGKGIAFQRKNGEEVEEEKITKIFVLNNKNMEDFEDLIMKIPIQYINVGMSIIQYAEEKFNKKLNEIIYISLVDHIYAAVERMKEGTYIANPMLYEIKRFYKDEFEIGLEAINILEKDLNISFPIDEAGFIALHFMEAQIGENRSNAWKITRLIDEISNIVKYHFKIEYNESSIYYYRFISHLKHFSYRLFEKEYIKNELNDLLEIIKSKYSESFQCVLKIESFLKYKYDYNLTEDEMLYLIIHIQKIKEEFKNKEKN